MANGIIVAMGICSALTGSIVVAVLATRDLPTGETAPIVEEASTPAQDPAAAPRRAPAPAASRHDVTPYPLPRPLDRGH